MNVRKSAGQVVIHARLRPTFHQNVVAAFVTGAKPRAGRSGAASREAPERTNSAVVALPVTVMMRARGASAQRCPPGTKVGYWSGTAEVRPMTSVGLKLSQSAQSR